MDINAMIQRAMRAIRLDRTVFQELAANRSLTSEAITFVVVIAIIGGIGNFLDALFGGGVGRAIVALIVTPITTVITFLVWSVVVFFVGTNLFRGQAEDIAQVIRPLGYAYAPQALTFFVFIPCLGGLASLIGGLLSMVAGFIAIRETMKMDDTNTLLTVIVSFIAWLIVSAIFGIIYGIIGITGAAVGGLF